LPAIWDTKLADEILLQWKLHFTCSENILLVDISGLQSGKKRKPDREKR
jgi:hypothetical protein